VLHGTRARDISATTKYSARTAGKRSRSSLLNLHVEMADVRLHPPPPVLSHPPESRSSSVSEQELFYSMMRYLLKAHACQPAHSPPLCRLTPLLTIMCPPPTDKCSVSATCAWVNQTLTGLFYVYITCTIHEIFYAITCAARRMLRDIFAAA